MDIIIMCIDSSHHGENGGLHQFRGGGGGLEGGGNDGVGVISGSWGQDGMLSIGGGGSGGRAQKEKGEDIASAPPQ